MQKQVLNELKELKTLLAKLIGSSDLRPGEQFSIEAIKKASKQYQKMKAQNDEWVAASDIGKYLRGAGWWSVKFIREEFQFTATIKQGHHFLFNKKALIALNKELKQREVSLERYIEYKRSEKEFQKKLAANKVATKRQPSYMIPGNAKNISTSPIPAPPVDLVRKDLETLKNEFFENKMAEYIDIYRETHAMLKSMYHFEKYIDPKIKRRCKNWCDNFNYANHALELITKKREVFVPVKEEEMIQL